MSAGGGMLWQGMLYFLCLLGTCIIVCLSVLQLPNETIYKYKILKSVKNKVWILRGLFAQTLPGFLIIGLTKRICYGYLSSRCRVPRSFGVQPYGAGEASVAWTANAEHNLFHEEKYVIAWRCQEGQDKDLDWVEEIVKEEDDSEWDSVVVSGRKLAYILYQLPIGQNVFVKICANNRHGRGPWSEVVCTKTFVKPNVERGFTGPLGPAGRDSGNDEYYWSQTGTELSLRIPIPQEWKSRHIRFKANPSRIQIHYLAEKTSTGDTPDASAPTEQELLVGNFPKKFLVIPDEVAWEIENFADSDDRHLHVTLTKAESMSKWPCLIDGDAHPRVDVRFVRFKNNDTMLGKGEGGMRLLGNHET